MKKKQFKIGLLCLTAFTMLAVYSSYGEELEMKVNPYDKQIYWKYLFNNPNGYRIFFNDAREMSFRFVKDGEESIFKLRNPVFLEDGDYMSNVRYAVKENELFVTYSMMVSEGVEGKFYRSYAYSITGFDEVKKPEIKPIGKFYRENAKYLQVVRIGKHFIALLLDYNQDSKMIEIFDEYKRTEAQYPVIATMFSNFYSKNENKLYYVNPESRLVAISLDTLDREVFSFDESVPEINIKSEAYPSSPLLRIFPKNKAMQNLYYAVPDENDKREVLLLEANLSTKNIRLAASISSEKGEIFDVSQFNERYVEVCFFNSFELYDIQTGEFIPLKGRLHVHFRNMTLKPMNFTPYQAVKMSEEKFLFKFFDDFAFDADSISRIRK